MSVSVSVVSFAQARDTGGVSLGVSLGVVSFAQARDTGGVVSFTQATVTKGLGTVTIFLF